MANYISIEKHLAKGKGKAGKVVGQPFIVRRLTPNGFVIIDKPVWCISRKLGRATVIEQQVMVSQVFEFVGDGRRFEVGDILTKQQGVRYAERIVEQVVVERRAHTNHDSVLGNDELEIGVVQRRTPSYAIVQKKPVGKYIAVRVEAECQVRRGIVPLVNGDGGYQDAGCTNEHVLVLPNNEGTFEFRALTDVRAASGDSVGLVPMQLELMLGTHGQLPFNLPMDWRENRWSFVCPNWPGLDLKENDTFISPEGDRYRLHAIHRPMIGCDLIQGITQKLES